MTLYETQFDGRPNSRSDLEDALADGLGTLILLEARLHEGFGALPAEGNGDADEGHEGQRRALLRQVSMLRAALQELRALMTPCDDPLVYGFVCARPA